jgi:hypothetical protein
VRRAKLYYLRGRTGKSAHRRSGRAAGRCGDPAAEPRRRAGDRRAPDGAPFFVMGGPWQAKPRTLFDKDWDAQCRRDASDRHRRLLDIDNILTQEVTSPQGRRGPAA